MEYPKGARVRLIDMVGEDLPAGLEGIIQYEDGIGQIHVVWDNGSTLALQPEHDQFVLVD